MALDVGKISATAVLNTNGFQKSISKTQREADKLSGTLKNKLQGDIKINNGVALSNIKNTDSVVNSLSTSLLNVKVAAIAAAAAIAAIATYKTTKNLITTAGALQKLSIQYKYIGESAEEAGNLFAFVRDASSDLGIDLNIAAESFAKLAAATKSSGIGMQDTKNLFIALSEASTALGLSAPQTALVFKAVEQIASKGKVSMEELRGQLGEQLPIAFGIAAKSMGMTTAEFSEFVQKVGIASTDFLPKFAKGLHDDVSVAAKEAANNITANVNRISQSFFDLKNVLVGTFKGPMLDPLVSGMNDAVKSLTKFAKLAGPEIVAIFKNMSSVFNGMGSMFAYFANSVQTAVLFVLRTIRKLPTELSNIGLSIKKTFADYATYATDGLQRLSSVVLNKFGFGEDVAIYLHEIHNDVQEWADDVEKIEYEPIQLKVDPIPIENIFGKFDDSAAEFIDTTHEITAAAFDFSQALKNLDTKFEFDVFKEVDTTLLDEVPLRLYEVTESMDKFGDAWKELKIKSDFAFDFSEETKNLNTALIDFEKFREKILSADYSKTAKEFDLLLAIGEQSIDSFSAVLADIATTGEVSFKSMIDSIISDLTRLVIKMTIVEPFVKYFKESLTANGNKSLSSSAGGFFSSIFSGIGSFFKFADGGVINEPVMGIGQHTGSSYLIGEKGPETIIPNSQIANLAQPQMSTQSGDTVVNNAHQNKTETIQNVNLSINAVDANSFVSLAQKNPQAIIGPFLSALRLGDKSLVRGIQTAVGGM